MSCPLILIREKIRKKILLEITYDFNEYFLLGNSFLYRSTYPYHDLVDRFSSVIFVAIQMIALEKFDNVKI